MSHKSQAIAGLIEKFQGRELNPHYLGYFDCFNRGLYFEAHDVLEAMWLPVRRQPEGDFFKGLIQLAGAFVHLQKNRLGPADALFRLARTNLAKFKTPPAPLDMARVLNLIDEWQTEQSPDPHRINPLSRKPAPRLDPTPGPAAPTACDVRTRAERS